MDPGRWRDRVLAAVCVVCAGSDVALVEALEGGIGAAQLMHTCKSIVGFQV
jgi:hypothetical protein